MTERRSGDLTDASLVRRRHRRVRIAPAGTMSRRRAGQILIASTTALVIAATVLGRATQEPDAGRPLPAAQIPIWSAGSESPVATDWPSSGEAGSGPSGSPPAPSSDPSPSTATRPAPTSVPPARSTVPPQTPPTEPPDTPPPARTVAPPPATTRPPATPPPAKPRLVGPSSLDGFDNFLDDFCEKQGFRGARLLNGRRTPETGRWVCTRFTKIETIDLDDACPDEFGATARARPQTEGDIRTVRCFAVR